MMKYLAAAAAALLLSAGTAVAATPITYAATGNHGGGSYTFSITTDGTIGTLTNANILDYSFSTWDASTAAQTHNKGDTGVYGSISSALTFTPTSLYLNYDDSNIDYFTFGAAINGYGEYDGIDFCFAGECTDQTQGNVVVHAYDYAEDSLSGTVRVGSAISPVAAVPEPATWAMMIGGFGLVGAAMRRRQRIRVAVA